MKKEFADAKYVLNYNNLVCVENYILKLILEPFYLSDSTATLYWLRIANNTCFKRKKTI